MIYEKNFDGLNSKQMLECINENFYKIVPTKHKLTKFTRVFLEKYCEEKGITPVGLSSVRLSLSTFGKYNRKNVEIRVNNYLVKSFEHFKKTQNFYYVVDYFDTILHELRHHEQFTSGKEDIHPIVRNSSIINRQDKAMDIYDRYSYYGHPLELDARHFAYQMLKSNKFCKPFLHSKEYIDDELASQVESPLDYVALLKDKDLRGVRGITKPLKLMASSIKAIALKNNLYYIGQKEEENINDQVNNILLNQKIASEIAPSFYSDEFYEINPRTVETMVKRQDKDETNTILKLHNERKERLKRNKALKEARKQISNTENEQEAVNI